MKIGHLEATILGLKKKESKMGLLKEEEQELLEQAKQAQEHIIQASLLLSPGNSAPSHHKSAQAKQCSGPPLESDSEREERRKEKKAARRKSKTSKRRSSHSVKSVPSVSERAVPSLSRDNLSERSHHGILGYQHPHDPDQHVHFMSSSSHRHLQPTESKAGLSKKSSHKLRSHQSDDGRHGLTSTHIKHHPQELLDDASVLFEHPRAEDSHVSLKKKKSKKDVEKKASKTKSRHHGMESEHHLSGAILHDFGGEDDEAEKKKRKKLKKEQREREREQPEEGKHHLQLSSHGHFYTTPDDRHRDNDLSHLLDGAHEQVDNDEEELEREEKPKKVRSTTSKKHLDGKKSKKDMDELNRSRRFSLSRDDISVSQTQ